MQVFCIFSLAGCGNININKIYLGKMFNSLNFNSTPKAVLLIGIIGDYNTDHYVRYESLVSNLHSDIS